MNIFTLLQVSSEITGEVAQSAAAATPGAQQGSQWSMWIMLLLIFVVMYFFMIRPQRKQQKEAEAFRNSLEKGKKVVTIGGIFGTIDSVEENTVLLEIDKGVKIKVSKQAIQQSFAEAGK